MALLDLFSSKNRILKHNAISLAHEIIDTSIWLCLEIRTILLIADEKLKDEHFLDEDDPDSMVGWPKMEFIKYILKNTTFLYMHVAHRAILGNLNKEEQSIFMLEMDKTIFELFLDTVEPVWRQDVNPDLALQKLNQEALNTMNFYGSYKLVEVYEEFATELAHYLFYYEGSKKIRMKAITHYKVLDSNNKYSLLKLNPETGRKHQLRKQLLIHGHPILGDTKYRISNNYSGKKDKLMLHAYKINFSIAGIKYSYSSDLPLVFKNTLKEKYLKNFQ